MFGNLFDELDPHHSDYQKEVGYDFRNKMFRKYENLVSKICENLEKGDEVALKMNKNLDEFEIEMDLLNDNFLDLHQFLQR